LSHACFTISSQDDQQAPNQVMPTTFQKFLSGRGIALGVLPLLPVLYLMTLVAKYSVNIPTRTNAA
jgi:hypothetical protein